LKLRVEIGSGLKTMIPLLLFSIAFAMFQASTGHAQMRASLKSVFGRSYGSAHGVLSLILLAGMLWAFRNSYAAPLYTTSDWGWWANWAFSLAGFVCLGIFLFRGSWRNHLRYPMTIGVCLWGVGHLLANGDTRSVIFFGGLMLASTLQTLLNIQSKAFVSGPERQGHNFLSVLFGIALYGITTQLHYALTGMELISLK
jgi:uncharacterized membrane protein